MSPEPGTLGSHYLHSTEIQSHPFFTPKITRFHTRELCLFGPYLCLFDPAARGKKVTAVTFFRCPTVSHQSWVSHLSHLPPHQEQDLQYPLLPSPDPQLLPRWERRKIIINHTFKLPSTCEIFIPPTVQKIWL